MTAAELSKKVGALRTKHQKNLNNVFIWSSFARGALKTAKDDPKFLSQTRFKVPSYSQEQEVKRSAAELKKIAEDAIAHEIFYSVFVYIVAQVEAFLNDVLSEVLRFDNRRLKTRVQGIDHVSKFDSVDVIDSTSRDDLIEMLIKRELSSLFYAAPALQMKYMEKVTGVELEQDIVDQWFEIRAMRDIIVHNSGVANELYLRKAGVLARAKQGERLEISEKYFGIALATMKSLVGRIAGRLQRELDAPSNSALLPEKL